MKRKKGIISLFSAIMISVSLVGCNSSDDTTTSTNESLTVWSHLTTEEVKAIEPIAKEWGEANGVDVKVVEDKGDFQAFIQAANSSKGPDVMFGVPHDNLGTFEKAGLLSEVPEGVLVESDYGSEQIVDSITVNSKQYALPISQETLTMFYNKDVVDSLPETMEEVASLGKEKGFVFDVANFYYAYGFLGANGGYVYKDNDGTLDPTDIGLNNEGAVLGYEFLYDLVVKDKVMAPDITGDIASSLFKEGNAAFYISGPWDIAGFKAEGVNFAVGEMPTLGGNHIPTFLGVQTSFVSAKSEKQDLAWELNEYLAKETADVLLNTGNRIPVLNTVLESDEFAEKEEMKVFSSQATFASPMPNIPEVQAMWTPGADNIRLLMTDQLSPKEAADTTVEQIKQGIEQQI